MQVATAYFDSVGVKYEVQQFNNDDTDRDHPDNTRSSVRAATAYSSGPPKRRIPLLRVRCMSWD